MEREIRIRGAHRGQATKLLKEFDSIIKTNKPLESNLVLNNLKRKFELLEKIDKDCINSLPDDQIESFIQESDDYLNDLNKHIVECELAVNRLSLSRRETVEPEPGNGNRDRESFSNHHKKVSLPKINIPNFSGNLLEWPTFWDLFRSAIHDSPNLTDIDKFTYLKCYLCDEAKLTIEGLPITSDNYNTAIDLVKQRFGQNHKIVNAFMTHLIEIEKPKSNDLHSLRAFTDRIESTIRSLESLGKSTDTYKTLLVPILWDKLPQDTQRNLARTHGNREWELSHLREALLSEVSILEACVPIHQSVSETTADTFLSGTITSLHTSVKQKTKSTNSSSAIASRHCVFCKGAHFPSDCPQYKDRSSRIEYVTESDLCFNCLGKHRVNQCRSQKRCLKCKRKHHTSICNADTAIQISETEMTPTFEKATKTIQPISSNLNANSTPQIFATPTTVTCATIDTYTNYQTTVSSKNNLQKHILLKTAVADVSNENLSTFVPGHILFDDGSQRSFVTQDIAQQLKLEPFRTETLNLSTFGNISSHVREIDVVKINVICQDKHALTVEALVVPTITQPLELQSALVQSPEFSTLKLAHPLTCVTENFCISLLIGSDSYYDFIEDHIIKSKTGPVAIRSKLGYLICGPTNVPACTDTVANIMHVLAQPDNYDLTKFWALETLGISQQEEMTQDSFFARYCQDSLTISNGMYYAKLPWLDDHPDLPSNIEIASNRTRSNIKRLAKNPERFKRYSDIIQDQLDRGVIEKVINPNVSTSSRVHYLPHHAVTKDSSTTPVRIVFDCSCKQGDLPSLNACLECGPPLLNDITSILMRFRYGHFGVSTDIEKAFLHIGLDVCDRDSTRFVWLSDITNPESEFDTYRFNRILFGAKSSPFILNCAIIHHLQNYEATFTTETMLQNIYVDNIITSFNTEDQALSFYDNSRQTMSDVNFNLRSWSSNCETLQKKAQKDCVSESSPTVKILGIEWNILTDSLGFSTKSTPMNKKIILTKRLVLQLASRVFDPLGILSPITVRSRILMQDLWQEKLEWDTPLCDKYCDLWQSISSDIQHALKITIPRHYTNLSENEVPQLHVFSDASLRAYGAVCYLKTISDSSFVIAKSRVAPLKCLTIPQLELMAATVAARLASHVVQTFSRQISNLKVTFWSDSTIVLNWINSSSKLPVFVNNRVKEIRKLTNQSDWQYCPTNSNPADFMTRGLSADELSQNKLWFYGPNWLIDTTNRPTMTTLVTHTTDNDISSEQVSPDQSSSISKSSCGTLINIERYSSFKKLLRITAWIVRFVTNSRKGEKKRGPLQLSEIQQAEKMWIVETQSSVYSDVIKVLSGTSTQQVPLIKQLLLFLDDEQVIRCRGRLHNAPLQDSTKFPILLPPKHMFTKLLVLSVHDQVKHSGVNSTVTAIRQAYWIPHVRQVTKSLLKLCVTCRKLTCRPYRLPDPPPLPVSRVSNVPPFYYTGVDFCGPFLVKSNDSKDKCYICLFTCAVTRAVHLELVKDLSTDSFLAALRRFSGRRSLPRKIISDNASTFICANTNIRELFQSTEMHDKVTTLGLEWQFITKKAPWQGGFYERLIGITKMTLKKILHRSLVSFEELRTIIVEIEAVVNNHPLTYISEDIVGGDALTPSQLLHGRLTTLPHPPVLDNELDDPEFKIEQNDLKKRADILAAVLKTFRTQWTHNYLTGLREYHRFTGDNHECVKIGSVVQIEEDRARLLWRLGVVCALHRGVDGHIRSVTLKTSKGITNRPISRLYPLEVYAQLPIYTAPSQPSQTVENDTTTHQVLTPKQRPRREAAIRADHNIRNWIHGSNDDDEN